MRREWSGWIRARQWGEFEKLAKSEPSQSLADTVAELELGFPEKQDRRVLRKVLFLLAQAGYQPSDIEDASVGVEQELPPPLNASFLVSADGAGESAITYSREQRGRVSWLIAHFNNRDGVTRAIEDTLSVDEFHVRLGRMRKLQPEPTLCAEVPVEYALARLAQSVSKTKSMPSVMACWRAALPKEIDFDHPAEKLPRTKETIPDLRKLIPKLPAASLWRLELGSVAPALEKFLEEHGATATEEQFNSLDWWNEVMAPHREQLFTQEVIDDHHTRLLDVAYLMHLKGLGNFGEVLAVADDLVENRAHSAYAQWMASKTLILLFETLKRESAKERRRPAGGSRS